MANPLIIFGAGASHGYSPYGNPPPLTDDLVDPRFLDSDMIRSKKYRHEVASLLSEIAPQVVGKNKTFEDALTSIKKEMGHHSHRTDQLVGLQFYLKDYFEKISGSFQDINHYRTLLSKISDYNGGQACLVTFNYDTLLEQSIGRERFKSMRSYIDANPCVIKLHGSHDWAHIAKKNMVIDTEFSQIKDSVDFLKSDPNYIDRVRSKPSIGNNVFHKDEIAKSGEGNNIFVLPAIAIPLFEKRDFLCPIQHFDALWKNIAQADRVLVIGWKAGDTNLIDAMRSYLKENTALTVVSQKIETAKEIAHKLFSEVGKFSSDYKYFGGGFAEFAPSENCNKFFTDELPKIERYVIKSP